MCRSRAGRLLLRPARKSRPPPIPVGLRVTVTRTRHEGDADAEDLRRRSGAPAAGQADPDAIPSGTVSLAQIIVCRRGWSRDRPRPVDIVVRVADDRDLTILAALRRAWNEESAGAEINDEGFDAAFSAWWEGERDSRTFFVVELGGVTVGMANVKRYERMPVAGRSAAGWWGYVGNVFVLPEYRNEGVGRILLEKVMSWSAAAGMEHLRLAPSPLSRPFYERLGFQPGSVVEFDPPSGQLGESGLRGSARRV